MNGGGSATGGTTAERRPADAGAPTGEAMVVVEDLHRRYGSDAGAVHALRGVCCRVPRGELVALRGRSGSGKTTLLNLIGGLDTPDSGRITVDGTPLAGLGESELLRMRRDRIGFVFQSFGLIPILSAAENVGVPLRLRKVPRASAKSASHCCCPWWASPTMASSAPANCPAASSSASP